MSPAAKLREVYDVHGEKIRYLIVGVWNTVFSYALFFVVLRLFATSIETATKLDSKLVAIIIQWASWVLAVVQSTVTMKYFAFKSKGSLPKQVFRAYFIYLPAQAIASVILWVAMLLLVPHLGSRTGALVGQLFAVFITTIFSYFGHKYFTFKLPLEVGEVPPEDLIEGN